MRAGRALFVALMLGLTAVFAVLGFWQMQRLGEKEALIAAVAQRMGDPAAPLAPAAEWPSLDPEDIDYRPTRVSGRFAGGTVFVFTSLADAKGEHAGPGYWVMTPFALEGGGHLFVNRGFIPQAAAAQEPPIEPMSPDAGVLTIEGVARRAEEPSPFTPQPDVEDRIDWIRNPERLAELAGIEGSVAPLYLDLPAGAPGMLPQGGETVFAFPNNHLGYALTWFGFALLTPILLAFWLRRSARES